MCPNSAPVTVTVGGAIYSTNGMRYIDGRYSDLQDGYGTANLAMARANRKRGIRSATPGD